ncbi:MAG: hypothetical protein NW241_15590 [Bacteroidia bacterium]|nr:hypothetical protein [Bacteroidia bacterium]
MGINLYTARKGIVLWASLGLLILSLLRPAAAQAQDSIIFVCNLSDYQPSGGHSFWLDLPGPQTERFNFDANGGVMVIYDDSSAHITGRVIHATIPAWQWDASLWLINIRNFGQWTALGRDVKVELAPPAVVNANKQNWFFWELDSTRSVMTGVPGSFFDGDTLNLKHNPPNYEFGFQFGVGANAKNAAYGISGWFLFTGAYTGHGDINANASCSTYFCDAQIASAAAACVNDSAFTVSVTVTGTGNTFQLSDNQGSPALSGIGAGTYTFGPYPSQTPVQFFLEDLGTVACADTSAIVTASCTPPPVCQLDLVSATAQCIPGSVNFSVTLTVTANGPFQVKDQSGATVLSGAAGGTFTFGNYPSGTQVSLFGSTTLLAGCADTLTGITASCTPPPVCQLDLVSATAQCIPGSVSFSITLSLTANGPFQVKDQSGTTVLSGTAGGTFTFGNYPSGTQVSLFGSTTLLAGCADTLTGITASCAPPPVCDLVFDMLVPVCNTDSTFEVQVSFFGTGTYQITDDQGTAPLIVQGGGTYIYQSYLNSIDVMVTVTDVNIPNCSVIDGPVTADCTPVPICDVLYDSIYTECLTDSTFRVGVVFTGSQSNYTLTDQSGTYTLTGLIPGSYFLGPYPAGMQVEPRIIDPGIFGCLRKGTAVSAACVPPVNATCAGAVTVECKGRYAGTTVNAQMSQPVWGCGIPSFLYGVWYQFTGTGDGFTFSTCGGPQPLDTRIQVFKGDCQDTICAGANDEMLSASCAFGAAEVTVKTAKGTPYLVFVSSATPGDFELQVLCKPAQKVGQLFPNPAQQVSSIEFEMTDPDQVQWQIVDPRGITVKRGYRWLDRGLNQVDLDISGLRPGVYAVEFLLGRGQMECRKLSVE